MSPYVRFLQLKEQLRAPALPPLDPLEERMLSHVVLAAFRGERLSVRDVMSLDQFGAPATIHSRLKSMRSKGWLELADTEDLRRKRVQVTVSASRHLANLSRCVTRAAVDRSGEKAT